MEGRGTPLSDGLRGFFEARLGHDFGRVRVHVDAAASETASELGAVAFAVGNDVAFASGRYEPETSAGRRLIAHELVHVVQQADSPARIAQASYGTAGPEPRAVRGDEDEQTAWNQPEEDAAPPGEDATPPGEEAAPPAEEVVLVQRQTPDAGAPDAAPPLAAPTLSLAPGATLTRGDTLTASVVFAPTAGETLTVTGWSYPTAAHGTVNRPAADADFQSRWSGAMAVSGEVVLTYRVTPAGGSAQPAQTVRGSVSVTDRTGAPWVSSVMLQPEGTLPGQPSPPRQFRQLGRHNAEAAPLPQPATTVIATGPNAQRTYVSSLTAGTFTSLPRIHPDLTNTASAFTTFHLNPSRLYLVVSGVRTLIPLTEYSGLTVAGGTLSFTVLDWEAFYKRHNFYRVTATAGGGEVVVSAAAWRLASNAEQADVEIANPAAVRTALGIPATQGFGHRWAPRGTWEGFQLMQAPAILAGTRSHEYGHATHSHRANLSAMMRALDPQRKIESEVAAPGHPVDFNGRISGWWGEIIRPDHELVDEAASRAAEVFVAAPGTMAGVNTDPSTGAFLGSVWSLTDDRQMT
ncbi:MAG: DUF4157 domain-containing protein [Gaiellaceae bacterium]